MKTTHVSNAVIVGENNKVLLTKRHDPTNPSIHGLWQIPGGGIEKNESPIDACIREAREETGLTVEVLTPTPLVIDQKYSKAKFRLNVFLVKPISGTIDIQGDPETSDAKWFDISEVRDLHTLDNTLEMLEGSIKLWKKH